MKSSLSSFRQGLTSGLKESAAWAASAATDLRRATGLVLGGESDPQQGLEDHLDAAQEEHLARNPRTSGRVCPAAAAAPTSVPSAPPRDGAVAGGSPLPTTLTC